MQALWRKNVTDKRVAAGRRAAHVCGSAIMLRMRTLDYVAWSLSTSDISACLPKGVHGGYAEVDDTSFSQGSIPATTGWLSTGLSQNPRGADRLLPNAF